MPLEYFTGKKLLDRYGIHSVESRYVKSAGDAVKFSKGEPIVLKVLTDKALHKSKAGLVKLNLSNSTAIKFAYAELERKAAKLKPYSIIAQKMSRGGVEIILGGREDPQFGKLVLLGLGGIYVEAFRDFALHVPHHQVRCIADDRTAQVTERYHLPGQGTAYLRRAVAESLEA